MTIQVSSTADSTDIAKPTAVSRSGYLTGLLQQRSPLQLDISWLQDLQQQAADRVQTLPLPSTRDEEWRFTDLTLLLQTEFQRAAEQAPALSAEAIAALTLPEASASRLVFVNGIYAPHLSTTAGLPDTLSVGNLKDLGQDELARLMPYLGQQLGADEVFTTLNTAGFADAAVIWVARNAVIEAPIHLLFISTLADRPTVSQPRCLVVAEASSALTLVEDYVALGDEFSAASSYFTNPVTEIWVGENAEVIHNRIQRDRPHAIHIGKTAVSQARHGRYTCNAISLGARIARHNLEVFQAGEQTETTLNGLTMIGAEQLSDTHSLIAYTQPHGSSRQVHKCIVGDRARAVFNGKVFVPQAAQLTDAGQINRNLLLSPKARVDTKPQLEIVADNVKCTHGATVSQLEADEVFYLQSRGIDAASAQQLLIYAFAFEIIDALTIPSLQRVLSQFVSEQTPSEPVSA